MTNKYKLTGPLTRIHLNDQGQKQTLTLDEALKGVPQEKKEEQPRS